jgi:hypothetical protein
MPHYSTNTAVPTETKASGHAYLRKMGAGHERSPFSRLGRLQKAFLGRRDGCELGAVAAGA